MDFASGCQPARGVTFSSGAAAKAESGSRYLTSQHPDDKTTSAETVDNGFGRKHRLGDFRLIRRARRSGRRSSSEHLTTYVLPQCEGTTKFCLLVPRKSGNSPQRNRMRRLMREFLRTHKELWPAEAAVVIEVRKAFPEAKFSDISTELAEMLIEDSSR